MCGFGRTFLFYAITKPQRVFQNISSIYKYVKNTHVFFERLLHICV